MSSLNPSKLDFGRAHPDPIVDADAEICSSINEGVSFGSKSKHSGGTQSLKTNKFGRIIGKNRGLEETPLPSVKSLLKDKKGYQESLNNSGGLQRSKRVPAGPKIECPFEKTQKFKFEKSAKNLKPSSPKTQTLATSTSIRANRGKNSAFRSYYTKSKGFKKSHSELIKIDQILHKRQSKTRGSPNLGYSKQGMARNPVNLSKKGSEQSIPLSSLRALQAEKSLPGNLYSMSSLRYTQQTSGKYSAKKNGSKFGKNELKSHMTSRPKREHQSHKNSSQGVVVAVEYTGSLTKPNTGDPGAKNKLRRKNSEKGILGNLRQKTPKNEALQELRRLLRQESVSESSFGKIMAMFKDLTDTLKSAQTSLQASENRHKFVTAELRSQIRDQEQQNSTVMKTFLEKEKEMNDKLFEVMCQCQVHIREKTELAAKLEALEKVKIANKSAKKVYNFMINNSNNNAQNAQELGSGGHGLTISMEEHQKDATPVSKKSQNEKNGPLKVSLAGGRILDFGAGMRGKKLGGRSLGARKGLDGLDGALDGRGGVVAEGKFCRFSSSQNSCSEGEDLSGVTGVGTRTGRGTERGVVRAGGVGYLDMVSGGRDITQEVEFTLDSIPFVAEVTNFG